MDWECFPELIRCSSQASSEMGKSGDWVGISLTAYCVNSRMFMNKKMIGRKYKIMTENFSRRFMNTGRRFR